jgi:hypothetical protein
MSSPKKPSVIGPVFLLAGAFVFAFLWGEMVHEYGHYLSHLIFGNHDVHVYLNPFGSSRIMGVTALPLMQAGITAAAGPLANLILGVFMMFLLWKRKRPILLPLLLWGPVAMIQEGVTFSLGLLTPGGDAEWISTLGISKTFLLIAGILLIFSGLVALALLLSKLGISEGRSRLETFGIILLGMCSLMLIRFLYSAVAQPQFILEDLVPLVFSLILAVIVVMIQPVILKNLKSNPSDPFPVLKKGAIFTAISMGSGIFIFQILTSIL